MKESPSVNPIFNKTSPRKTREKKSEGKSGNGPRPEIEMCAEGVCLPEVSGRVQRSEPNPDSGRRDDEARGQLDSEGEKMTLTSVFKCVQYESRESEAQTWHEMRLEAF